MISPQQTESPTALALPTLSATPRVSVIIPTYNSSRFITEALDSVFSQNYDAYEVIVIDDGSTDDTPKRLCPYRDRLRYVCQENAGSAAARNRGLDLARGEFVVFLDADDFLLPGKLREQAAFLQLRPSAGMVHSGWKVIDEYGRILSTVEPWHEAPHLDVKTWFQHKPIRMGAMMMRRLWLESVGGLDPQIRQSHDVDLMLRLALAGCTTEWMYKHTMCYRQYGDSTIRRNALRQHGYVVRVMNKFYAHPKTPKSLRKEEKRARYYQLRWLGWHMFQSGYPAAIVPPLRQAMEFSPFAQTRTVFDWVSRFIRFFVEDGRDMQTFPTVWPYFQQATNFDDAYWGTIERLLYWWLAQWPVPVDWSFNELQRLWAYYRAALCQETVTGLPVETMLDWRVYVWDAYLCRKYDEGAQEMVRFQHLSPEQLRQLTQFCIVEKPQEVDRALLERFWQDAGACGLIPLENKDDIVSLYLTFFGQQALGRQWGAAARSFLATMRRGAAPGARRAWRKFIAATRDYYALGRGYEADLLVAGLPAEPDDALAATLRGLVDAGAALIISSKKQPDMRCFALTWNDWLPADALTHLTEQDETSPGVHGRILRQYRKNHHMQHFRRLPVKGNVWRAIYFPSLSEAAANMPWLHLGYPTVVRCLQGELAGLRCQDNGAWVEALKQAAVIHCLTGSCRQELLALGIDDGKIYVIGPGIDVDYYCPAENGRFPSDPFTIIMAGPLVWQQGHEEALTAVRLLADQDINYHLHIIGSGPGYERVLFTIHDLALEPQVTLHNHLLPPAMRQRFRQADLFLSGSVTDGLTYEMLAAMACGLPVVAAAAPCVTEAIQDGVEGGIVPAVAPAAMAKALQQLATDASLRQRLGAAARTRVSEQFALTRQVGAFQQMLSHL